MVISRRQAASIGSVLFLFVLFSATKAETNETQTDSPPMGNATEITTSQNMSDSSMTTTTAATSSSLDSSTTAMNQDHMNAQYPSAFPPPPPPPPVTGTATPDQETNQTGMMDHSAMGHSPMPAGTNDSGMHDHDMHDHMHNHDSTQNPDSMATSTMFPDIKNADHNENLDKTKYDVLNQSGRNAGDSPLNNPGSTVGYSKEIGARPSGNQDNSANQFDFQSHLLIATLLTFFYHFKFIF